jgi:hypothetical protein
MTDSPIDETQRKAARVVGLCYLLGQVPAIFARRRYCNSMTGGKRSEMSPYLVS